MSKFKPRARARRLTEDSSYAAFRNKILNRSVHGRHLANSNRVLADTLQKARNEVKKLKLRISELKKEGVDLKVKLTSSSQFANCFAALEEPEKEAETLKKAAEQLKVALHRCLSKGKESRIALKNLHESYAELKKHLNSAVNN